ncbi:Peptidyl-prolyl cis-trans isomerase PASTICCINO1 [Linum grandiflorum]
MMAKVDKSSESDSKAALHKLKQTKQEVERKARKQFKGLFDKKPGEIADVAPDDKAKDMKEESTSGNHKVEEEEDKKSSDEIEEEPLLEDAADEPRPSLLSRLWPVGGRLFSPLGLQRCNIL